MPTIHLGHINEVQKYLTLDRHVYSNHIFPVNAKWFNGLPPVYQLIIQEGANVASQTAQRNDPHSADHSVERVPQGRHGNL